jgi:tetratricopeptide (TPR) repeat protein
MRSVIRIILFWSVVYACFVAPVFAQEQTTVQAAPVSQQAEAVKLLQAALQEKDPARRVAALEAIIRDNPGSSMLPVAYSSLLSALSISDREKAEKFADELLAKFPDPKSPIRRSAYSYKFVSLRSQKKTEELHALATKLLETESEPSLLILAATADKELSVPLFEKAIAERGKNPNATAAPTAEDLRWQYGQALIGSGRKEEGLKMSQEVLEASLKSLEAAEALPPGAAERRVAASRRRTMMTRYQSLSRILAQAGDHPKALEYLDLSVSKDPMTALESRSGIESQRADIYRQMGKPDLQMESYVRAYAARIDATTREKIEALARSTGSKPEKAFDRARKLRKDGALPIVPFELKSVEGKVTKLSSVKSKVTLINFFFPT